MSMYANANSCVDRLNTEGSRDSVSQLTQTADKRREQATPAETDKKKKKQERLRKQRRETGPEQMLYSDCQMGEMRTRQCECLVAKTTADNNARLQQVNALQCERLAVETTTERHQILQ